MYLHAVDLLTYLLFLFVYFLNNRSVLFPGQRGDQTGFSFFVFIMCCSIFCHGCTFAFVVVDFVLVLQY